MGVVVPGNLPTVPGNLAAEKDRVMVRGSIGFSQWGTMAAPPPSPSRIGPRV